MYGVGYGVAKGIERIIYCYPRVIINWGLKIKSLVSLLHKVSCSGKIVGFMVLIFGLLLIDG